jgi:hypothetical protein
MSRLATSAQDATEVLQHERKQMYNAVSHATDAGKAAGTQDAAGDAAARRRTPLQQPRHPLAKPVAVAVAPPPSLWCAPFSCA